MQRVRFGWDEDLAQSATHGRVQQRIEEAIGADGNDVRAKKVKERVDHYAAQQVEEGVARGK